MRDNARWEKERKAYGYGDWSNGIDTKIGEKEMHQNKHIDKNHHIKK